MPFMKWESTFELNIEDFDDHHKHLLDLMNTLYADFAGGSRKETLGIVIGELVDYAAYHFQAEESWMQEHKYPAFSRHQNEHITFTDKVREFNRDFQSGKTLLAVEVLAFLMNWLKDHILKTDAGFVGFARDLSDGSHHSYFG